MERLLPHAHRIVAPLEPLGNLSVAETAFNGVKLADAKWKQDDARLTFSDNNKNMVVRVADRDFVTVPYDQLEL